MNVDRILLLAREYASAYSLKDQSEVSRTWMNLKRALQEAAAPQQAEPVGEVRSETCHYSMMPDRICNKCGRVHGYSHPTAAPQRAEPALNERVGLAYKNGYEEALNDCIRNGGEAWARSMFANGGEHIKPQQAEPVAWVRNLTDPQPHCVTGLQYRTAADADAGVQYIPVYLHPPAAEVRLQGGLDNEELLEAWRTKVPGVEPTDSDLRAFALGVEFGTRGKRVYFDERNSARDAWRRRVKQCETLEAEVQRLRDALTAICAVADDREEGNYDTVPIHFIRSIARDATKGGK